MEKYTGLAEITKQHLDADLYNLSIHYEGKDYLNVHIEYKDNVYIYDYDLGIDKINHTTEFFKHDCNGHGAQTSLKRNVEFEKAIETYLFHK